MISRDLQKNEKAEEGLKREKYIAKLSKRNKHLEHLGH
jgi:hypothetical protein